MAATATKIRRQTEILLDFLFSHLNFEYLKLSTATTNVGQNWLLEVNF
jgi:hypothetical protein